MSDFPPPPGSSFPPPPPPGGYPSSPPPPPPGGFPQPPAYGAGAYGYGIPTEPQPVAGRPAHFGLRLGAWFIDAILLSVFLVPAFVYLTSGPDETVPISESDFCDSDSFEFDVCTEPTDETIGYSLLLALGGFAAGVVYRALLEGGPSGQSVGKRAVGIRVVDATSGASIGRARALGRAVLALIMFLFCGIAYLLSCLWPLWDPQRQTLHDKAVNAMVVQR